MWLQICTGSYTACFWPTLIQLPGWHKLTLCSKPCGRLVVLDRYTSYSVCIVLQQGSLLLYVVLCMFTLLGMFKYLIYRFYSVVGFNAEATNPLSAERSATSYVGSSGIYTLLVWRKRQLEVKMCIFPEIRGNTRQLWDVKVWQTVKLVSQLHQSVFWSQEKM